MYLIILSSPEHCVEISLDVMMLQTYVKSHCSQKTPSISPLQAVEGVSACDDYRKKLSRHGGTELHCNDRISLPICLCGPCGLMSHSSEANSKNTFMFKI